MLILQRKKNQSIQIGDITVTVVRIGGDLVKLGIEAPKDVNIARTELLASPAGSPEGKAHEA